VKNHHCIGAYWFKTGYEIRIKKLTEYQVSISDLVHFYSKYNDTIVANVLKRFTDAGIPPVYLT
jgi:hypothetical protein